MAILAVLIRKPIVTMQMRPIEERCQKRLSPSRGAVPRGTFRSERACERARERKREWVRERGRRGEEDGRREGERERDAERERDGIYRKSAAPQDNGTYIKSA